VDVEDELADAGCQLLTLEAFLQKIIEGICRAFDELGKFINKFFFLGHFEEVDVMDAVLQEVDDIIQFMDQLIDVLPVKRSDEALVEETDDLMGFGISLVLNILSFLPITRKIAKFAGKLLENNGDFMKTD